MLQVAILYILHVFSINPVANFWPGIALQLPSFDILSLFGLELETAALFCRTHLPTASAEIALVRLASDLDLAELALRSEVELSVGVC